MEKWYVNYRNKLISFFIMLLANLYYIRHFLSYIFLFQTKQESVLSTYLSSNTNQYSAQTEDEPTDNLYLALIQCFGIILCG